MKINRSGTINQITTLQNIKLTGHGVCVLMSLVFLILGILVFVYGYRKPLFTVPEAPDIVVEKLENLPQYERVARWSAEMSLYDTGHKKYTDWGRGIISLGIGVLVSVVFLNKIQNKKISQREWMLKSYFATLWVIKVPLLIWYHFLRVWRYDYPIWADSGAGWVVGSVIVTLFGYILFSAVINTALKNHALTGIAGIRGRVIRTFRGVLLIFWSLFIIYRIFSGVYNGDESAIVSNVATIPIILLLLSATPNSRLVEENK